jgi:hypothetical protein
MRYLGDRRRAVSHVEASSDPLSGSNRLISSRVGTGQLPMPVLASGRCKFDMERLMPRCAATFEGTAFSVAERRGVVRT